jgi:hypothetical protein
MFYLVSIAQPRRSLQRGEAVGDGLYDPVERLAFFQISSADFSRQCDTR